MLKEIVEQFRYAVKHPIQTLAIVGMFSGIIPSFLVYLVEKIV